MSKLVAPSHPSIKITHYNEQYAKPAELQALEKALAIESTVSLVDKIFQEEVSDISDLSSVEEDENSSEQPNIFDSYKSQFPKKEWNEEQKKFFNFKSIGKQRKWLQELFLSDSSDISSGEETEEFDLNLMLKIHLKHKKIESDFCYDALYYQDEYAHYSSSLITEHDRYHDRQKKRNKSSNRIQRKPKLPEQKKVTHTPVVDENYRRKLAEIKEKKQRIQLEKDVQYKRRKLWNSIVKKDIPKACRNRANTRGTTLQTLKKVAQACQRERRKEALRSQKISKDALPRARRMAKEMLLYWRRFDRVEKEHRKKAEKEAIEQRRQDEEMREMKRQQRKLNFLITQTELYAHFMGKKMKGATQEVDVVQNEILKKLDDGVTPTVNKSEQRSVNGGVLVNTLDDDYDADLVKSQAIETVQNAVFQQKKIAGSYNKDKVSQNKFDGTFSLANPNLETDKVLPQPKIFVGQLKPYQLKGMNWLVSLYEKGINGILADEMGLGKTVQSIVFLAYLAEVHNIWGPFLVVAPASTLHNWQQEFTKFLPRFKVLPYWGDTNDRKSLRKFWNQKSSYTTNADENAGFHVLVTSYQLIVQDVKYFQRVRWQYLVLDEAHAIKSSQSLRWKILLGYNCRNRLLLTGTPIQNTMAELWALLHFIMPTLFDSHDEFNEWFSKDIENRASEKTPSLDQNQLSRLHMILKPFMLRRVKKDVENELSEKIEIKMICEMSLRQKLFYQAVKNKIMFEDLLQSTANSSNENKSTSILMNLVMQFRKVCNHPELFERKEPSTCLYFTLPPLQMSKRLYNDGILNEVPYDKVSLFHQKFILWNAHYVNQSLKDGCSGCFSFTRFVNISPCQCEMLFKNIYYRLVLIFIYLKELKKRRLKKNKNETYCKYLSRNDLLIYEDTAINLSNTASDLCFTNYRSNISGFNQCLIQDVCSKNKTFKNRIPKEVKKRGHQRVYYPRFLISYFPKVNCGPPLIQCSSRRAAHHVENHLYASPELIQVMRYGIDEETQSERQTMLFPPPSQGLNESRPYEGWSKVKLPDKSTLLSDSGKLSALDRLLTQLKQNDHRVLIYSQMTKMIDILEEFMNFRQHNYIRLDGSSKISDRRDMVNDFQSKNDIFAFLLSTRAGGLGINLTAADTVIFYDSDWNPTVDQQAMDRAHRLGQTRQVTVYRLVTKGTIEEKILNRAREKSEIQNIVISGGQFNKDVLRPKEVVSLLLDDVELEAKLKQRQTEKKAAEEHMRRGGRKRKNNNNEQSVELANSPASNKRIRNDSLVNGDQQDIKMTEQNSMSSFDTIDMDENSVSSIELGTTSSLYEDDSNTNSSRPPSTTPASPSNNTQSAKKRGGGAKCSGKGRSKAKSGTLAKAAASAAALAGAAAGSAAAYAAYGYSFQANNNT